MSLRGRLLVLMMLLNLVVLGFISVTTLALKEQWTSDVTRSLLRYVVLPAEVDPAATNSVIAVEAVRDLLEVPFGDRCRDIMIKSSDYVDINPLGSAHRDPAVFPYGEIRAGIRRAADEDRVLDVAGGIAAPIRSAVGEIEGGVWFVPMFPVPQVSVLEIALPLFGSWVVFVLLAGWVVGRTLGPPIALLGDAAARIEAGDYGTRVPPLDSAPELVPVGEAFNAMATKVEGHTVELESEVRRATEEAAAKERALVMSSRLASMGTLAAGVAHEINNPIGGMLNAVHRLAGREHLTDDDRRYLRLIQQGLERVARTSRKLLDFTPRVIDPIGFHVRDAVEGAHALVEHALTEHRIGFEVAVPEDLPELLGDPHEIQQVLLNLFLNSVHAMRGMADRTIRVRAEAGDRAVRIHVDDDGPGVAAGTLDQVMNPFYSSSNRPDATGLGLFISFTIIQNHGGDMRVHSAPGEGFHVELELPRPGEPARTQPGRA